MGPDGGSSLKKNIILFGGIIFVLVLFIVVMALNI
jgi:hypothetical protein